MDGVLTMATVRNAAGRRIALIAALAGLTSAGCGYGSQAVRHDGGGVALAAAGDRTLSAGQVRIGYLSNLTNGTALVGIRNGLLARELGGTTLKAVTFNAGPSEIEALNAGSIDIGWIGPSPAINGYARSGGSSLRIISGSASGGVRLVVNPAIRTPEDLRGRRIATPQLGNTQDVALLTWLASRGWHVDAASGKGDVSVIRLNNALAPAAYRSGSIDGAWVPEPTASKLLAEGAKVLLDESTLWPGGRFVTTNIVVSQKFLAGHPDVVEAVLRGSVATNDWIRANPDRARAAANAALRDLTGKELPADVINTAWRSIEFTDDPLAATLRAQAQHAVAGGFIRQADLTDIFDLALLNRILASLGRPEVDDTGLGVR
jgi:NitT/TauT family transport system substrate-binding protein